MQTQQWNAVDFSFEGRGRDIGGMNRAAHCHLQHHSRGMDTFFLRRMVRVVALTAIIFCITTPAGADNGPTPHPSFPYTGPLAEELAKSAAQSLQFPVDVDAKSRLESLVGKGRTLWYRYSLKSLPETEAAQKELRAALTDGLESSACDSQNFAKLLQDGYTLVISYSFSSPKFEVEHVLLPRRCEK